MTALEFPWDRLVRFLDDSGKIEFGNALASTEGLTSGIQVEVLRGESMWSLNRTGTVVTPKRFLGPLDPHDVPIVRCIGLNYKTHSECGRMCVFP